MGLFALAGKHTTKMVVPSQGSPTDVCYIRAVCWVHLGGLHRSDRARHILAKLLQSLQDCMMLLKLCPELNMKWWLRSCGANSDSVSRHWNQKWKVIRSFDPACQHRGHASSPPSHRAKINPTNEDTNPKIYKQKWSMANIKKEKKHTETKNNGSQHDNTTVLFFLQLKNERWWTLK